MRLYTMEQQEWREANFEQGAVWRSREVYECGSCGTRTNRWEMGGYPNTHPCKTCPGEAYQEHGELARAVEEAEKLNTKIKDYQRELQLGQMVHCLQEGIHRLMGNLWVEQQILQMKIARLRRFFAEKMLHDVEGIG